MHDFFIKDAEGGILHSGRGSSLKGYIESLVKEGRSLEGADLRGRNLAHLNLDGAMLRGALLDGADLRGTVLRSACLEGASLRGVRASGINAARADFTGADLTSDPVTGRTCTFEGGLFTFARFDRSLMFRTDFTGSHMSSSTMVGVRARRAVFARAVMHNTDWADSKTIACDFTDAEMRPTWKVGENHLPDRTMGAVVAGNRMKGADLGPDMAAFRSDALVGQGVRAVTWSGITAAAVIGGSMIPFHDLSFVADNIGTGAGFVAVTTAAMVMKERVQDLFRDVVTGWVDGINLKLRTAIMETCRKGAAIGTLTVALFDRTHSRAVAASIREASEGPFKRLKACAGGNVEVIVCDRERLAEALARVTDAFVDRFRQDADVVLTRTGGPSDVTPKTLVLLRNGGIEAGWIRKDGQVETRSWRRGESGVGNGDRDAVLDRFMRAVIVENDASSLEVDPATHSVRRGRDGSAVVVRRSDGRLHNPLGPVILTPEGESVRLGCRHRGEGGEPSPRAPGI